MWTLVSNLKERQGKCGWTHTGLNIMDAKSLSQACVLVQTQWWKIAMHINGMVFTNWYGNVSNTQHLQQGKQHKVCFVLVRSDVPKMCERYGYSHNGGK